MRPPLSRSRIGREELENSISYRAGEDQEPGMGRKILTGTAGARQNKNTQASQTTSPLWHKLTNASDADKSVPTTKTNKIQPDLVFFTPMGDLSGRAERRAAQRRCVAAAAINPPRWQSSEIFGASLLDRAHGCAPSISFDKAFWGDA